MDKLSFFTLIDFDQIPILKQALIDSGVWKTKEEIERIRRNASAEPYPVDMNKTLFVKKFFDKMTQ
jgi:hypothetical protein